MEEDSTTFLHFFICPLSNQNFSPGIRKPPVLSRIAQTTRDPVMPFVDFYDIPDLELGEIMMSFLLGVGVKDWSHDPPNSAHTTRRNPYVLKAKVSCYWPTPSPGPNCLARGFANDNKANKQVGLSTYRRRSQHLYLPTENHLFI